MYNIIKSCISSEVFKCSDRTYSYSTSSVSDIFGLRPVLYKDRFVCFPFLAQQHINSYYVQSFDIFTLITSCNKTSNNNNEKKKDVSLVIRTFSEFYLFLCSVGWGDPSRGCCTRDKTLPLYKPSLYHLTNDGPLSPYAPLKWNNGWTHILGGNPL